MRKSQNPTGSIQEKLKELQRLLRKREKELYSIQRVSKAVGSTLNIDRLLLLIMREITVLMEAERSTLYIVDHEKNELWAKVAIDAEISEIRQIIGKGISGTVALTGETINLQDVYADPRFDPVCRFGNLLPKKVNAGLLPSFKCLINRAASLPKKMKNF